MLKLTNFFAHTTILVALVCFSPLSFAQGSVDYSAVDVSSLQSQYQSQLKPKAKPRKKIVAKKTTNRKRIPSSELLQYQQLLAGQQHNAKTNSQQRQLQQQRQRAQQQRLRAQQQAAARRVPARPQAVQPRVIPQAVQRLVQQAPAPRRDAIFEAAGSGNVRLIGQLLNQGVNVNQANTERETALHMAAAKGHYSAVIYLINNGANIHSRTINNWQPIHHATRFRHAQIANYLKQKGSQIYAKTSDGMSAVDMARAVNDRRIMGVFGVR